MANRSKENVKRFAENISKEMALDAYNGGSGGTTVIANPELEGTEPNLEGLEVDGAKYKVPGVEYVTVARMYPEIHYSDYQKLLAGAYIRIDNQQEAEYNSSDIICLPNHNVDELVYTSTVKNGKYYKVVVTVISHIEFEATCTITEETVGGKDNRFLGLGFELKSALHNKHLSVNALLSLLEKYGIDASNTYNLHIGSVIGNNGDNNEYELINACFDGSTSAVTILNETINDSEYYSNINQGLIALKNLIETCIIADGYFPMENLYCANLSTEYDAEGSIFISPEEIYELFTQ